jgi:hypothetical protein
MKAVFWVGRHARIARLVYGLRFKGLGVALPPWRNQMRKSSNQTTSAWQEIRGVRRTHGKRNLWDQPIAHTLERERERRDGSGAAASRWCAPSSPADLRSLDLLHLPASPSPSSVQWLLCSSSATHHSKGT